MAQGPSLFDDVDDARPTARRVLRVSELTGNVKAQLEEAFGDVWVEGEVSSFHRHGSGHCYFTLVDEVAQIRCVLWRHFTPYVFFEPKDGLLVRVHGKLSFYERRGSVQIVARSMQLAGEGALQRAFEALKAKLAGEGLFEAHHKKPLPRFPETIGVVTSGSGAALEDVLSILQRRFALVRVLVCPVPVQGLGAAEAIAEAVEAFNAVGPGEPLRADLLIVGRGGGSAEDLWAFNEERVARALFASKIPVISAVGHETDVALTDFVADVRAATPSMAAELAVPDRWEVEADVRSLYAALHERVSGLIREHEQRIRYLTGSYAFRRPVDRLRHARERLDGLTARLSQSTTYRLRDEARRLDALERRLQTLDPMRPLARGYAWVERDGQAIREAQALGPGDEIMLRFSDGSRRARVEADPRDGTPSE